MKKKILTLCLCVILCSASVVFGTLAYFTDTEFANVSTITMGGVQIEWVDPANADNTIESIKIFEEGDIIIPGETKTATLAVKNTGTVDAYLRVNVGLKAADKALFSKIQLNGTTLTNPVEKTVKVGDEDVTYMFYSLIIGDVLVAGNSWESQANALQLTLDGSVESDKSDYQIDVHFLAEAIQKTGFDNATAAFNAFDGKTN